jgi:SAM-dependent methyltransferase
MSTILILFIIIGVTLYGLQEYYQIKLGIRPRPTPESVINYLIVTLEEASENGSFIDLGSAYGATIFGLAKRLPGWEFTGVEKSPTPWILANLRSVTKNFGNYRFFLEDAAIVPLRNYNVIFIDQNATIMKRWEPSLARRLDTGTTLFALNAPLPRVRAINRVQVDEKNVLYVYQKAVAQQEAPTAQQQVAASVPQPTSPVETLPQNEQTTLPTQPNAQTTV